MYLLPYIYTATAGTVCPQRPWLVCFCIISYCVYYNCRIYNKCLACFIQYIHIYIIWDLGLVKINFNHKWDYHHMGNLARWNVVYLDAKGQGIE